MYSENNILSIVVKEIVKVGNEEIKNLAFT